MSFFKKIFLSFTPKERITFLISSALAAISFFAIVGIVIAQATRAVPVVGGEYTEGIASQPEYVNPVTASTNADLDLVKMIYSNVNDVADKIDVSPDGKTWTVHLKENLHWQDGEQLTSDDVVFTVQSIQNPDAQSALAPSWQGVNVSRSSELEVQFSLPVPYAFFGDNLKNLYIIPKHIFSDIPPGNWRLSEYNTKPIGSGPYKFVSYEKGTDGFISSYHLTAWNASFAKQPLIENFTLQFFRNESDLLKAFNNGSVDGFAPASPDELSLVGRPYNLFSWRATNYYAVFLNQGNNVALQDPAVRAALSLAVDRNDLVSNAIGGNGKPDYGPIPPDAVYAAPLFTTTSQDAASETLDTAGWKLGPQGIRIKTTKNSSTTLALTLTVPNIDFLVETAERLQSDWQKIGVQTSIATSSPDTIGGDVVTNRSYEALLFGNVLGPSSDLYSFWDSSERFSPGLNLAIYSNANVDSLIAATRATMNDASRTQMFAKIQNDIANDDPAVFLYSTNDLYVATKNVQGISTDTLSDPSDRFREVPDWYLETARVLK